MKKLDLLKPGGSRGLRLVALVKEINDSEDAIQATKDHVGSKARSLLTEASLQGQRLLEAKEIVGHGNFTRWLAGHCPLISDRTARVYMRIAANWQSAGLEYAGTIARALLLCEHEQTGNGTPTRSWPAYVEVLGKAAKFVGYVERHPIQSMPPEAKVKLREYFFPVAEELWPELFKTAP